MLDRPAEEVVGLDLDRVAVQVVGLDLDLPGPPDLAVEAGEAEAAFLVLLGGVPLDDLGVDEDLLLVGLLGVGGEVEDEEPERDAHLVGRQADPVGGVHQVEHLADGRPEVVVDLGHRPRLVAEGGMRIGHDPKHDDAPGPDRTTGRWTGLDPPV